MRPQTSDNLLIDRIAVGEEGAWQQFIDRFEGRLLAFVASRVPASAAEDVVQETFLGFLTSLPNYDRRRPLESYLFSIAAHKLTDALRRHGRRPKLPLAADGSDSSPWEPVAPGRGPSSLARSGERRHIEESALVQAMTEQIEHWRRRGQWQRLECAELLLVRGWTNKETAEKLGIPEQTVANYKFELIARLRGALSKQDLPPDVFPELYETS